MANDITTTDQTRALSTRWSEPALPEKLALLVDSLPEALPVLSVAEIEGLRGALLVYDTHPKGTTARQVNKMLTKLALAYPNARLSDEEAEARMELYVENLGDIDVDVLAEGFRAAVRKTKFFPSVSELRAFAMEQPAMPRVVRHHRLRVLLARYRDQEAEPVGGYVTPEEASAITVDLSAEREILERAA